jgi:hypothetical protein
VNQIITLLTNLFNLTKVASVTLPGLLAAAGFALILWPAVPVDVIPAVVGVEKVSPPPNLAKTPACKVEHWAMDDVVYWMDSQAASLAKNPPPAPAQPQDIGPAPAKPQNTGAAPALNPDQLTQEALRQILVIEGRTTNLSVPGIRKRAILEQFALDYQVQSLGLCADLEKSWSGKDEIAIQQLTADLEILEKQRSAAQDNYLAYLKANNRSLIDQYKRDMRGLQDEIKAKRNELLDDTQDKKERERRAGELLTEQQEIKDRLGDPGRLRPRVGFDLFVTGLINHIVAFILLSLAAAVMVTAFDRAAFGFLFEDLFDGF